VGRFKCNKVIVSLHAKKFNGEGKRSGSGTFWLDPEDGTIVKSDLQINEHENAPISFHEVISRIK
jgi:hypothetical protein